MKQRTLLSALALPVVLLAVTRCGGSEQLPFGLRSEVVTPADRVSAIAFAPDGRIFFAEQLTGAIRIVLPDGTLQPEPFAQIDVATHLGLDWGLTGLALDPDFAVNGFVYAFYTARVDDSPPPDGPVGRPTLVRFRDDNGRGVDQTVITDDFPETPRAHPGFNGNGKIAFGPDGFLYLSIGDYDFRPEESPVQSLDNPIGKLLRIAKDDGSPAPNNPFLGDPEADPRIYAYGFREPFPFAFHPQTGRVYATDNTTVSCEELNLIGPGANYGWPDVGQFPYSDCGAGQGIKAVYHFARPGAEPPGFLSFVEVSSLAFVSGALYPQLGDSLLVCESHRSQVEGKTSPGVLRRLTLGASGDQVMSSDVIVEDCKGAVAVSPEGVIYYANDTEIRRLLPEGDRQPPTPRP
jgi:glucose/arabinose dehydrogenase